MAQHDASDLITSAAAGDEFAFRRIIEARMAAKGTASAMGTSTPLVR